MLRDRRRLLRRLALRENHLRHSVTQRAMMIHLGESKVLERQVSHASERRIHVYRTFPHLLEKLAELIFVHIPRVSARPLPALCRYRSVAPGTFVKIRRQAASVCPT